MSEPAFAPSSPNYGPPPSPSIPLDPPPTRCSTPEFEARIEEERADWKAQGWVGKYEHWDAQQREIQELHERRLSSVRGKLLDLSRDSLHPGLSPKFVAKYNREYGEGRIPDEKMRDVMWHFVWIKVSDNIHRQREGLVYEELIEGLSDYFADDYLHSQRAFIRAMAEERHLDFALEARDMSKWNDDESAMLAEIGDELKKALWEKGAERKRLGRSTGREVEDPVD